MSKLPYAERHIHSPRRAFGCFSLRILNDRAAASYQLLDLSLAGLPLDRLFLIADLSSCEVGVLVLSFFGQLSPPLPTYEMGCIEKEPWLHAAAERRRRDGQRTVLPPDSDRRKMRTRHNGRVRARQREYFSRSVYYAIRCAWNNWIGRCVPVPMVPISPSR
jgi:hypothetical protein